MAGALMEDTQQQERYCPSCEKSFAGAERCPDDGTMLVRLGAPVDRLVGTQLDGRYTINVQIGAGGMGAVYRAMQHSVGREVAVKVVSPSLVNDPQVVKRFLREAKLTSRLSHPNAVAVLDFGQTPEGLFYLVMELLEGRTLGAVLAEDGPFPPARLARVGSQILDALIGAHSMSIVHRDLKPSNVYILDVPRGRDLVKVLDFGLAKSLSGDHMHTTVTGSGAMLGTPAYMPPEAALGRDVDERGDLYSLGVILYQLASGVLPITGETVQELLMRQARDTPRDLRTFGVPPEIADVVARLMAKDPAARYVDAGAAQRALEAAGDAMGDTPAVRRRVVPASAPPSSGGDDTLPASDSKMAMASTYAGDSGPVSTRQPVGAVASGVAATPARRRTWPIVVAVGLLVAALAAGIVAQQLSSRDRPAPVAAPPPDTNRFTSTPDASPRPAAIAIDAGAAPAATVDAGTRKRKPPQGGRP
ncbi:MAG TPA: serine/threonine-protein kinase, partial [Kofleriaceae bacterium]|nr:serine/threonine-protein kinase [Kofleriaceae bacterium]